MNLSMKFSLNSGSLVFHGPIYIAVVLVLWIFAPLAFSNLSNILKLSFIEFSVELKNYESSTYALNLTTEVSSLSGFGRGKPIILLLL